MSEPASVRAPQSENAHLRLDSKATVEEAVNAGRSMSRILLPPAVYNLLKQSLGVASRQRHKGIRLRLVLDDFLCELSWEFLYRPDVTGGSALSGFLTLDPSISVVRGTANEKTEIQPVPGKQRLLFVGTFWPGGKDTWQVQQEYDLLRAAMQGVEGLVQSEFLLWISRTEIPQPPHT